ncbi:hypothetical protein CEXT_622481 [Caerostris extrusa]|uniref:RNase H type-1 domain-containing protein n=1 Tax=Caerostris extrusa TaxID=172846 RepID=A0AAV4RGC1_CAEEX|nr:hypothetical protein CEXT_622481 [Caerostris extrusa]
MANHLKATEMNLELILPCNKVFSEAELKSFAIAYERYPLFDWLHVYADGSEDPITENAGAEVFCQFFQLKPLGAFRDNFDEEISVMLRAAEALKSHLQEKIVFFIDSQAAIRAVINRENVPPVPKKFFCKKTISHLIENGRKKFSQIDLDSC